MRELLALREKLIAAPGRVADAAVDLLGRERYDLAWLTFSAAHLAGHQFWDLSQLAAEPEGRERELLTGALADVYEAVDGAFGRVLAALPGDADVIVARPSAWTSTARAPTCCRGCSRRCCAAAAAGAGTAAAARSGACAPRSRRVHAARSRARSPTARRSS